MLDNVLGYPHYPQHSNSPLVWYCGPFSNKYLTIKGCDSNFEVKGFILKATTNETTTLHLTVCTTIVLENFNNNYHHFNKHDFLTKFSQNNCVIFSFVCKIAFNCFNNTVRRTPAYLCYFLYFSMMMWSTCYSSIWHCYYPCVQRSSPRQLVY